MDTAANLNAPEKIVNEAEDQKNDIPSTNLDNQLKPVFKAERNRINSNQQQQLDDKNIQDVTNKGKPNLLINPIDTKLIVEQIQD